MWNICLAGSAGEASLLPAGWAEPCCAGSAQYCGSAWVGAPHPNPGPWQGACLRAMLLIRPVSLGFVVLINLTEFKILTKEAYTVCNLSFWSISAVWQFFPTASLSENS